MRRQVAVAASCSVVLLSGLAASSPAWAAPTTEVVQGEVLRIVSVADWEAAAGLAPSRPVQWDVTVSADAPDPGTVRISVSAAGEAALLVDAALCAREWQASGCPGGATVLEADWELPRDGVEVPLLDIADSEVAHLRFTIALESEGTGSTEVTVHAQGSGESVMAGPGGALPATGLSPAAPWILGAGAALLLIGAALLAAIRPKRDAAEGDRP